MKTSPTYQDMKILSPHHSAKHKYNLKETKSKLGNAKYGTQQFKPECGKCKTTHPPIKINHSSPLLKYCRSAKWTTKSDQPTHLSKPTPTNPKKKKGR